jgi:hypothetical protein
MLLELCDKLKRIPDELIYRGVDGRRENEKFRADNMTPLDHHEAFTAFSSNVELWTALREREDLTGRYRSKSRAAKSEYPVAVQLGFAEANLLWLRRKRSAPC